MSALPLRVSHVVRLKRKKKITKIMKEAIRVEIIPVTPIALQHARPDSLTLLPLSPAAFLSTLLNKPYDAFADEGAEEDDVQVEVKKSKQANHIHIRIQQRNGRKTITTLQGVPSEYDPKKLLKAFKKEFACNGSIVDDEEMGKVIQLQGDQRQKILEILIEEGIEKETIKMHGF
ncbi:translation initiation factor eIF1 [Sporobolomyces koalae]|uniref:translation initiation factor eIF1 n=1 Tax=Sporobolomyces koalae TaxID=500713 RepID=UPI0031787983